MNKIHTTLSSRKALKNYELKNKSLRKCVVVKFLKNRNYNKKCVVVKFSKSQNHNKKCVVVDFSEN